MSGSPQWDVAVVGAGPAGLSAAWTAARTGARTVVLERAQHPRYKTCGGGLVATSSVTAANRIEVPVRDTIHAVTFTREGRLGFTRRSRRPLLMMTQREEFDDALRTAAQRAGAKVLPRCPVRAIEQDERHATARLNDGSIISARIVVGADGSSGVTARHVGVEYEQVDLGLEVELPVCEREARRWRGRVLIDWGAVSGSYGWLFPKGDQLTVGVIAARGAADDTRAYLDRLTARLGLAELEPRHDSGHLTRCRSAGSPLHRGRVLVAGDAAGLLDPWTREGISFALRSGSLAGEAAAAVAVGGDHQQHLARYADRIDSLLGGEMDAGARLQAAFSRHPVLLHAVLATPWGWRMFTQFCRSEATLESLLRQAPLRVAIAGLGRW